MLLLTSVRTGRQPTTRCDNNTNKTKKTKVNEGDEAAEAKLMKRKAQLRRWDHCTVTLLFEMKKMWEQLMMMAMIMHY